MSSKKQDSCAPGDGKGANGVYDLAVIGAGSAGFSAAITAADEGAQVALIGRGTIGGTCVNIGCIPSKTLIRAAETLHHAGAACRFRGLEASGRVVDWSAVMADKTALVDQLRQAKYIDVLPSYNRIAYLEGAAKLAENGVTVNGEYIEAAKTVIATGSAPLLPPISGIVTVLHLTSTSALELEHLPNSLMVIGGGVVGCELGQMFARLGVAVTILCRSRLLPDEEPEISEVLKLSLVAEGVRVVTGVHYKSIRHDGDIHLEYERDGSTRWLQAEQVLVATGRRPNTDGLGLQDLDIAQLSNGGIKVDDRMQTTRAGVYAAGDVTGRDMFVYMAAHGAKIAALNALNGDTSRYDDSAIPEVVFTDPQVASVGLTEAEAKALGLDPETSLLDLGHLPRAVAARDIRGLIKLVAERDTKKLLGAHILASEGADSIQTAALAIRQGLTYEELGDMIFPYLTTVEGLKLAAQTFCKDVTKLSCCSG